MIHKTLHHLRSRPVHERSAVARVLAFGFAGILLVAWALVFFSNIKSDAIQSQSSVTDVSNQSASAITAIKTQVQGQYQQAYASTTEMLNQLSVAAEIEAQREADAAQSATGTASIDTQRGQ